jgi:PAS domain S-box-containing protein
MSTLLRILIVEDAEDDALLLVRHIQRGGYEVTYERVEDAASMNTALNRQSWDIIISDYALPTFNGLAALKLLQEKEIDIPFIIVSGTIGEDVAVRAMKAGAHDYVMKGNLARLIPAIQRELQDVEVRRERKRAEEALLESEDRYRRLFEESKDAIYISTVEGKFLDINQAGVELFGYGSKEELLTANIEQDIYTDRPKRNRTKEIMHTQGFIKDFEQTLKRRDGKPIIVLETATPVCDAQGNVIMYRSILRDVTKQKLLEQQFIQAQKMESIGTLASGIAHDFNNILCLILGCCNLLKKRKITPKEISEGVNAISQAVERGAALVNQILTFARKTEAAFGLVNLPDLARELLSMLKQTFPKIITFKGNFAKNVPDIYADRTQMHQVLLNLCVNARDAMPNGGLITMRTELRTKEQVRERFPSADQEMYVCLSVTDTGEGMDEITRLRIFDPFFTTKDKGKGTGLGLSVVYGVMQAHHGFIELESKLGRGTTFRLYFPVPTIDTQSTDFQIQKDTFKIGGTETILFVEDEDLLSTMVRRILEFKGYTIHIAKNGKQAIKIYKQYKQKIALVLTDLDIPGMSGIDEFKKLRKINPAVKVIFASGFFEPHTKSELLKARAKGFIQKPYSNDEVLRKLREVLDEKNTS